MIDLRNKSVLVAGGAGLIGSQLVRELVGIGSKVVVYDNLLAGTKANLEEVEDVELVIGDVNDEWKLLETFKWHEPDYVFDLVGDTYVPSSYILPKRMFMVNTIGTLNVLMACKNFDVKRIAYTSSTEVFGEESRRVGPLDENQRLSPLNTYAVSKAAADMLCKTFYYEHDTPIIVLRVFNSFGPRESHPYVIPEIISQLSKGNIVRLGNIEARRDFTYVSDTAKGMIAAMCSDIPNGEVVNIGSGKSYSVKELVEMIADIMGVKNYKIEIDPKRLRKHDISEFLCDNRKLREATGWTPQVSIRDGLKMTVDWYLTHGKRWGWEGTLEGTLFE